MKRTLLIASLVIVLLLAGCGARTGVTRTEFDQLKESTTIWVQKLSTEISNQSNEILISANLIEENQDDIVSLTKAQNEMNKILVDHEARIGDLEDQEPPPPPPPPNETKGTWLVYKASIPLRNGTIEFDVTGLSSAGTVKDVMFCLLRGLTVDAYNSFRYDIRKYGEHLQLMKSVLGRNGDAVESYWDNGGKIYWESDHTYHFTITWDENGVRATRYDKDTGERNDWDWNRKDTVLFLIGETNQWSGNYPAWMNFNPMYICIGWNPKYGIPPGGYYSNIILPSQADYELVKYKP